MTTLSLSILNPVELAQKGGPLVGGIARAAGAAGQEELIATLIEGEVVKQLRGELDKQGARYTMEASSPAPSFLGVFLLGLVGGYLLSRLL